MNWIETKIYTTTYGIEIVCGLLSNVGIYAFEIEDATDFNNFIENNKQYWDYIDDKLLKEKNGESCVKVYLPDNMQGRETLMMIKNEIENIKKHLNEYEDLGRLEIELGNVKEEDWANNWKKYFKPLKIGDKILIKPSWIQIDNTEGRKILEIDPGMSFGTGMHNTTQLCITFLEDVIKGNEEILDMGCGSGILSIAGLILGAKSAFGIDVDQNAAEIALKNNQMNGFGSDKFTSCAGNIIENRSFADNVRSKQYDVICANIVADVIIAMAKDFYTYLKDGGKIICSGIISQRKYEVISSLESIGFKVIEVREDNDWIAVLLTK